MQLDELHLSDTAAAYAVPIGGAALRVALAASVCLIALHIIRRAIATIDDVPENERAALQ